MIQDLFDNDEDNLAHRNGWLVLAPGEAYERRLTTTQAVYIFKTNTSWMIWRAFWPSGHSKPASEKKLSTHQEFIQAFQRAESYVDWRLNGSKKKAAGG